MSKPDESKASATSATGAKADEPRGTDVAKKRCVQDVYIRLANAYRKRGVRLSAEDVATIFHRDYVISDALIAEDEMRGTSFSRGLPGAL